MIQCSDCEYFYRGPDGQVVFRCDPFSTIKEPECLAKWQLVKIDTMVRAYQATLEIYNRLAPMQEKMFKHMEDEINDVEEAENWKYQQDDDDDEDDDEDKDDEL